MNARYPRRFVSKDHTLDSWEQIEPYFITLQSRSIDRGDDLEKWLLDLSELAACMDEVRTDRYVKMTCQTDDPERERLYLDYVENIDPRAKPLWHGLNVKYVASPATAELSHSRYQVLDRSVRNQVSLFRDENVPLQTEEAKLEQRFQKVSGAMTVTFEGREQTLPQMAVYGEKTDRNVRQAAWEISTQRRLRDADELEDIFDELFRLRHRIALNTGLPNYRDYAFKAKERFDYSADDCLAFHEAIEQCVVPVFRQMRERRRSALKVSPLRPWDLAVDEQGLPPLKPFQDTAELFEKCLTIFRRLDPALEAYFREMREQGYLDLDSRKGKAPGGYQSTYSESRHPFIFMNAVGLQRDVSTLIHEAGHAFHAYECRHDPLVHYRSSPIEFAEVASMGMEMLTLQMLDEFYSAPEKIRAQKAELEGIVAFFPWMATIDAFQHWMYTHPDHTRAQRREQWLALHRRFGGPEDYSGYEEALARSWQRQLHLFEVPFYYVEYGIAQLGALQLWQNARRDRAAAVSDYRRALALGGSRPLPELFKAAGLRFDFSIGTLGPLMHDVSNELAALS